MAVGAGVMIKYSLLAAGIGTSAALPLLYTSTGTAIASPVEQLSSPTKDSVNPIQPISLEKNDNQTETLVKTDPSPVQKLEKLERPSLTELKETIGKALEQKELSTGSDLSKVTSYQEELTAEEKQAYQEFVLSLWNILRSTLWVEEKFGTPLIPRMSTNFPTNKTDEFKQFIKTHSDEKLASTVLEVSLTSEDISNMKKENTKQEVKSKQEAMYDLFSRFCFSTNWEKSSEDLEGELKRKEYKSRELLCSFGGISSQSVDNLGKVNTLTFVRNYEGKPYFLDIFFNTKDSHTQLMVQYVSYKDESWWSAGIYAANGTYDNYRRHIGGDIDSVKKTGYPVTAIDKDFSLMFRENPESLYRVFSTLSNCLLDTECSIMFHRVEGDYQELSQRTPGISRSDSWREEVYRAIHPFSRKYWEVDKKMKEKLGNYKKFLGNKWLKTMTS